jgi:hypothetical protein
LGRIGGTDTAPKEDDIIQAVIQRIEVEKEEEVDPASEGDREQVYRRLMRRLQWQLRNSLVTPEELVRNYPKEVRSILVFKSYERGRRNRESTAVRERLIALGFESIQPGLWILAPMKTPPGLDTQEALRLWFRHQMSRQLNRSIDYVFPFVASVDLKRVVSERRGIRKMPIARTLFGVLTPELVVPPSHVYSAMRSRGMSIKDILLSGDIQFLSSAFAEKTELEAVQDNEQEVGRRLKHSTGSATMNLEDIANLGPDTIASALKGFVAHPRDFAQRLLVEAQYWMRFLGGTVPS